MSYFVYGEKIELYTEPDQHQKEFMEAGLDYLASLNDIGLAMPFYRVYPTKVYRDHVRVVNRLMEVGKQSAFQYTHFSS